MGWIKKAAIGLVTVAFFVVLAGLLNPAKPRSEQIKEGCTREFEPEGVERIQQCQLELMIREQNKRERDRTSRAAS